MNIARRSGDGAARAAGPRCDACGSPQRIDTCDAHFERLLARDHSRQPPWGALHTVAVGCFFLQHPAHPLAPRDLTRFRALLQIWLSDGDAALQRATSAVRRGDAVTGSERCSERRVASARGDDGDGDTIEDLSVDGTFPADGYRERLRRWAQQLVASSALSERLRSKDSDLASPIE